MSAGSRHHQPAHYISVSVVAAIASYLDARHHGGRWFVRIDDIDPPREAPGAASAILRTLQTLQLEWDGEPHFASTGTASYQAALEQLRADGVSFDCACSRRDIGAGIYPGTCRDGLPAGHAARSIRVRVDAAKIGFHDLIQGTFAQDLGVEVGDFVVRRADGLFAYHLATCVDDAATGVTHIVRGADLIDSTPRQLFLQGLLRLPTPVYAHIPVAVDHDGQKFSKQTGAAPVTDAEPIAMWLRALHFLGQPTPDDLITGSVGAIRDWAVRHWALERVPRTATIECPPVCADGEVIG